MIDKKLISSSNNFGGIYRAILIDSGGDLRIVIPGLHDKVPVTTSDDGKYIFDIADYEKSKDSYPKPMWNVPNLEAQQHEKPIHPCWITFENGISTRPIIMGWLGDGIMYHASSSSGESSGDGTIDGGNSDSNNTSINASSINDFLNSIVPKINGKDVTPDTTHAFEHGSASGTQCVELPNYYLEKVFGLKNNGGFGNGNTYYIGVTNRYPDKFTKIVYSSGTQLQAGDIISLEGSQKQYGHAAIVKSVSGNNITILEQWDGSIYVIQDTFTLTTSGKRRIIGIARPK